jgi:hypothetical protein
MCENHAGAPQPAEPVMFGRPRMSELDDYIDAAAALIDLEIAQSYRPGVRSFLGLARDMAVLLETVPLNEDELAPAPV